MSDRPSVRDMWSATIRAATSVGPPAPNGTIRVIGLPRANEQGLLHLLHAASAVQHRAARSTDQGDTHHHHIDFLDFLEEGGRLAPAARPIARAAKQSPVSARPRHVVQPSAPVPEVDARPSVTRNRTNGAQTAAGAGKSALASRQS